MSAHRDPGVTAMCVVAVLSAACAGATPTRRSPPLPVVRCPDGPELVALARAAWGEPTAAAVEPTCVPARVRGPAWVVSGIARDIPADETGPERNARHTAIVAADAGRGVLASSTEADLTWQEVDYGPLPGYQAHDLDGDGVDELLTTLTSSEHGELVTALAVTRVIGDGLELGAAIAIGYDDDAAAPGPPGPTSCDADVRVVGRVVEVTARAPAGDRARAAERCLPAGVHRFVLDGGALRVTR